MFTQTRQGGSEDILGILISTTQDGEPGALRRLQTVRLALARYFARCAMIGVGGKHVPSTRTL